MLQLAVRRRQGDFQVEMELEAGRGITALFGPSGSGKTSLINMVAGLTRPDAGRIAVNGRVLFDSAEGIDLPPERRRLGYVFQEPRLFPHLSVTANLVFGQRRVPVPERKVGFDDVVEVLGIGHLLERRPAGLSGGEKQRVAIGRAILASPRILLMDEPLASLDAARKAELLPFIGRMARHFGVPILYVSHSMDEVLRLADTLVLIAEGRKVAAGPTEDLLSRADLRHLTGHGEAGAVVRAVVDHHDDGHGVTALAFAGGTLLVERTALPPGSPVRLRIHARDVAVATVMPQQISVRNIIAGKVASVAAVPGNGFDVMLDCNGAILWSKITALAQDHLRLAPGMPVFALVKAGSLTGEDIADRPSAVV